MRFRVFSRPKDYYVFLMSEDRTLELVLTEDKGLRGDRVIQAKVTTNASPEELKNHLSQLVVAEWRDKRQFDEALENVAQAIRTSGKTFQLKYRVVYPLMLGIISEENDEKSDFDLEKTDSESSDSSESDVDIDNPEEANRHLLVKFNTKI